MRTAIMQPYFFPYIGYFQLIRSADLFIIYDNIQYTKKGWINRNRFLQNGSDALFSLPLKKDSDFLTVRERSISPDFNKTKFLNQFTEAYRHAPFREPVLGLIEAAIAGTESSLFRFIHQTVVHVCQYLGIDTRIVVSSSLDVDLQLRGQDKVIAYCKNVGATDYINAIGGMDLYRKEVFEQQGIRLKFLKSGGFSYKQFDNEFVPALSIIDVMMFNDKESIGHYLANAYELI